MSPSTVRIMPLGDSITAGVEFIDDQRTCEAGGYRTRLWRLVSAKGPAVEFVGSQCDGPADISRDHEGHPGWRTAQLLEHVDGWVEESRPEVVLLMSGTNDVITDQDASVALERLEALVGKLFELAPALRLAVASIPPLTWSNSRRHLEPLVLEYNRGVRGLAEAGASRATPTRFADVHGAMEECHLIGTHPSPAGYERIAEVWYPVLTSLLEAGPLSEGAGSRA